MGDDVSPWFYMKPQTQQHQTYVITRDGEDQYDENGNPETIYI